MNAARDNFFKECPAVMNYSMTTDYRNKHRREQYVKYINGFVSDYDYRRFLQQNANKIMDAEFKFLMDTNSCRPNPCIHNSVTSPPAGDFNAELKRYNEVRVKGNASNAQCTRMTDYRLNF